MLPVISILTPTRDRPDLLARTIHGVQAQSLEAWQMIVVDDGDGSGQAFVESLRDPRITAMHCANIGQVAARNAALRRAQGRYIHLLDDDDRWDDARHLERTIGALGTSALAYRHGFLVLEAQTLSGWVEHERIPFEPYTTRESLRRDNTLLTSGVAYPRALHDTLGGFDETMGNYWDWDWFLRVSHGLPLVCIGEPAVLMSWRGSNTSSDPHKPQRLAFLQALIRKHGLLGVTAKNHASVIDGAITRTPLSSP